ncbi:DUF1992 domain-containing protein [Ideonella sp. B508-1]|uniref:DnaJ family domain-containing protein n=1 Tax=Ideonella sp. B508-1 TaxID=137716 RepID=UPI0019007D56|nr:DUF1992 domain-containing protein [Ideonella sp. B508-1]
MQKDAASGELQSAKNWGKPLDLGDGFYETPEELRMGYKILKDAGCVPPEVEMLKDLEVLKARLNQVSGSERQEVVAKIADLQLRISLRMDQLRG